MSAWTGPALDRELRALAGALEHPPVPDLAAGVGERLRADAVRQEPAPRRRAARGRGRWLPAFAVRRPALAALLALVLAFTAVLAASPAAREAVARWLGIRGARIQTVPTLPPVPSPTATGADLGDRVSLARARAGAAFDLVLPQGLGPPDAVFLDDRLPGGRVTLAWDPSAKHPRSEHTGYGLVLTQFRGDLNPVLIGKEVHEGGTIEFVMVDGRPGYFVGGEDHVLTFYGPDGVILQDTVRLAGPTLLWERGPLTLRLEGELTLDEALDIARSVG